MVRDENHQNCKLHFSVLLLLVVQRGQVQSLLELQFNNLSFQTRVVPRSKKSGCDCRDTFTFPAPIAQGSHLNWRPPGHLPSPKAVPQKDSVRVMVLFASAAHFIVRTIKRTCQLFMYFTFLLAPSGGNKREHGVEAVKEKERCFPPPQRTAFWLRKCFPRLHSGHCGNNTVAVFIGQTSPRLLNTISCNLHRYYLQRDACCMASSPAESHPLYSPLQSECWSWGSNRGRNDSGKQGVCEGEGRSKQRISRPTESHLKCTRQRYLLDALTLSLILITDEVQCFVWW